MNNTMLTLFFPKTGSIYIYHYTPEGMLWWTAVFSNGETTNARAIMTSFDATIQFYASVTVVVERINNVL